MKNTKQPNPRRKNGLFRGAHKFNSQKNLLPHYGKHNFKPKGLDRVAQLKSGSTTTTNKIA
jgi:hypothetical protein